MILFNSYFINNIEILNYESTLLIGVFCFKITYGVKMQFKQNIISCGNVKD